jgi:hypothetical protein
MHHVPVSSFAVNLLNLIRLDSIKAKNQQIDRDDLDDKNIMCSVDVYERVH